LILRLTRYNIPIINNRLPARKNGCVIFSGVTDKRKVKSVYSKFNQGKLAVGVCCFLVHFDKGLVCRIKNKKGVRIITMVKGGGRFAQVYLKAKLKVSLIPFVMMKKRTK